MDSQELPAITIEEPKDRWKQRVLWVIILFLIVNLGVVDFWQFFGSQKSSSAERIDAVESQVWSLTQRLADYSQQVASESSEIDVVFPTITQLSPTPTHVSEDVSEVAIVTPTLLPHVRDYFIPLGSANVQTADYSWTNTAVEVLLDLSNYPSVTNVTFDAVLSIQSGQVEARLFNATDGYEIGGSTLVGDGNSPQYSSSSNLSLPSGSKVYRVQMRTSLNFSGSMENARVRIRVE